MTAGYVSKWEWARAVVDEDLRWSAFAESLNEPKI